MPEWTVPVLFHAGVEVELRIRGKHENLGHCGRALWSGMLDDLRAVLRSGLEVPEQSGPASSEPDGEEGLATTAVAQELADAPLPAERPSGCQLGGQAADVGAGSSLAPSTDGAPLGRAGKSSEGSSPVGVPLGRVSQERIERAWAIGRAAEAKIAGVVACVPRSPDPVPGTPRARFYAVLRCAEEAAEAGPGLYPRWQSRGAGPSRRTGALAAVALESGRIATEAVFHGFASAEECEAYARGAGEPPLRRHP